MTAIEFGLDTFGDISLDDRGAPKHAGEVIRDVVAQAKLADELGLQVSTSVSTTAMITPLVHRTRS